MLWFVFVVVGPELRRLLKLFVGIPTEEFLAKLVKSRAHGASTIVIDEAVELGPEVVSQNVPPSSEVVAVGNSESNVVLKEKDKKRHREGTSSRNHHSKKFKEPVKCLSSDEVVLASKIGLGSSGCTNAGVATPGQTVGGGLRLYKDYVDKVHTCFLSFCLCLFFSSLLCFVNGFFVLVYFAICLLFSAFCGVGEVVESE